VPVNNHDMWQVPCSFWQMGQIGGPSIWLSGTLLVIYQIFAAEHDKFLLSRMCYVFFDNAFLDQFLIFCVALSGLMV